MTLPSKRVNKQYNRCNPQKANGQNTVQRYEHIISRTEAVKLACFYLQERLHNGSRNDIIFKHAVHIFNVAKIAEHIAKQTLSSPHKLDPDTAYILGLLHDIGRIKDETKTKVPHGLEGFYFLIKAGLPELAPISLTHNFVCKQISAEDFPVYSKSQIREAEEHLSHIEYNDYDRLIQLADTFSRGDEILSIQERLNKTKKFYHTPLSFEPEIFSLRNYFNQKYNIDVENLVNNLFKGNPKEENISRPSIKKAAFSFRRPQVFCPFPMADVRTAT